MYEVLKQKNKKRLKVRIVLVDGYNVINSWHELKENKTGKYGEFKAKAYRYFNELWRF